LFRDRHFEACVLAADEALAYRPEDIPAAMYKEMGEEYMLVPPGDDFDATHSALVLEASSDAREGRKGLGENRGFDFLLEGDGDRSECVQDIVSPRHQEVEAERLAASNADAAALPARDDLYVLGANVGCFRKAEARLSGSQSRCDLEDALVIDSKDRGSPEGNVVPELDESFEESLPRLVVVEMFRINIGNIQ